MVGKLGIFTDDSLTWLDRRTGKFLATNKIRPKISFLCVKHGKLSIVSFGHKALFSKVKPCGTKLSHQTDFLLGQYWTIQVNIVTGLTNDLLAKRRNVFAAL